MTTPFIRTLFEMRVFMLTLQFGPMQQFFSDVFSAMVALSATAQFVICDERTLLCGDINDGGFDGKIFSHRSKIYNKKLMKIMALVKNGEANLNMTV